MRRGRVSDRTASTSWRCLREFPTSNSKQQIERFARFPGGQVASAMVCCARLGWRARYLGRFGSDELGDIGRNSLVTEGVDVSAAEVVAGAQTRFAMIIVDGRTGDRTVLWDRDPRLALTSADVPAPAVRTSRILLVDCDDVEASVAAATVAREAGVITAIDVEAVLPGLDRLLPLIDIVIASEGFPERWTASSETGPSPRAAPCGAAAGAHVRDAGAAAGAWRAAEGARSGRPPSACRAWIPPAPATRSGAGSSRHSCSTAPRTSRSCCGWPTRSRP